ncbi:MAG: hypothetical protein V3V49_07905 [Candidatus Krumholzibacteria bacterium]
MFALLPLLILVIAVVVSPLWFYARKRNRWFGWDYALLTAPLAIWFLLVMAGIGPQSLSNIIELFIIALVVILLLYARVFVIDAASKHYRVNSMVVFVLACAAPVILRFTMPLIPE